MLVCWSLFDQCLCWDIILSALSSFLSDRTDIFYPIKLSFVHNMFSALAVICMHEVVFGLLFKDFCLVSYLFHWNLPNFLTHTITDASAHESVFLIPHHLDIGVFFRDTKES